MNWNMDNINYAVFDYKCIRQINILHNGKEYTIQIIVYSINKSSYSTEFWINGKNNNVKIAVKVENRQIEDAEALKIISENFKDWVDDYENIIKHSIL